jgi:hypothetical protein
MSALLYAPAAYWRLTRAGRAELQLNGCGPSGWKNRLVPEHLLWVSITAACDIHDYMYITGRTEADREESDRVFLNNMLRIVEGESSTWLTRDLRRRLALRYYATVRDLGGPYFWQEKNPPETYGIPTKEGHGFAKG